MIRSAEWFACVEKCDPDLLQCGKQLEPFTPKIIELIPFIPPERPSFCEHKMNPGNRCGYERRGSSRFCVIHDPKLRAQKYSSPLRCRHIADYTANRCKAMVFREGWISWLFCHTHAEKIGSLEHNDINPECYKVCDSDACSVYCPAYVDSCFACAGNMIHICEIHPNRTCDICGWPKRLRRHDPRCSTSPYRLMMRTECQEIEPPTEFNFDHDDD